MFFSKEEQQLNNFVGPKYILINDYKLAPSE